MDFEILMEMSQNIVEFSMLYFLSHNSQFSMLEILHQSKKIIWGHMKLIPKTDVELWGDSNCTCWVMRKRVAALARQWYRFSSPLCGVRGEMMAVLISPPPPSLHLRRFRCLGELVQRVEEIAEKKNEAHY